MRRKRNSRAVAEERSRSYENRLAAIEKEKAALRRTKITKADKHELGVTLAKWPGYVAVLKPKLEALRRNGIHGADEIAHALNRWNFKTASGLRWTPRLVKLAKEVLTKPDSVPQKGPRRIPTLQATKYEYAGPSQASPPPVEEKPPSKVDWNRTDEWGL